MTDLHDEVVQHARRNVSAAIEKADDSVRAVVSHLVARAGDLLDPLRREEPYDLIYE